MDAERACRVCGCIETHACVTGGVPCHWVEPDLCSACVDPAADTHPAGRRWLPAAWLDEMNPTMLESPDRFIERVGEGWGLRLPEGDEERDNDFYQMAIEPGQIVLFMWTETYGDRQLMVQPDRSFTVDQPVDARASHFYEHSNGILADSIAEMVEGDDVHYNDPLEPGEYVISTYAWSDPISFRFEVDGDGAGRFAPSAGAN